MPHARFEHLSHVGQSHAFASDGRKALAAGGFVSHGPHMQIGHVPHVDEAGIDSRIGGLAVEPSSS